MDRREQVDVVVVGAGPAGLAACAALADAGLAVRLIDEQPSAGGQVWRNAATVLADPVRRARLAGSYEGASAGLAALDRPGIRHAAGATLIDVDMAADPAAVDAAQCEVLWLGSRADRHLMRLTRARALILATGAMERPLLFPGATLPGVMGVGAVQTILKQSALVPDGGVVLAGHGPLLLLTLVQILDHGGTVEAMLELGPSGGRGAGPAALLAGMRADPRLLAKGAALLWRARRRAPLRYRNVTRLRALGGDRIEAVSFEADGGSQRLDCNLLAVHDGVIPNTQLSRLLGLDHLWHPSHQAFAPRADPHGRTGNPAVWVAGDGAGIAGVEIAGHRGRLAGLDVARVLGGLDAAEFERRAAAPLRAIRRRTAARVLIDRLYPPLPVTGHAGGDRAAETVVCRCEDVTLRRIHEAIDDGATGPNRVKTFTRCGMGPCQGRMCGNPLTRIIAARTRADPAEIGALRIRPPLKPTLISDYLGLPSDPEPPA